MGVDVRWFNHDAREFVKVNELPANDRYHYTGHPSACVFYNLVRHRWNGDRVSLIRDDSEFFHSLVVYRDVTAEARDLFRRWGCWCVPGQTPDDLERQP